MARLASDTKMGFYPTHKETVQKFISKIEIEQGAIILDPCCGEGEALKEFENKEQKRLLYGNELDEERAKKARSKLDVCLNADGLGGVRRNLKWASLLFLNPPYGVDSSSRRLEVGFLQNWGTTVMVGGYMLLVINPESANQDMAKEISKGGYKVINKFYDPDSPDYQNYRQFMVLLKRIDPSFRQDPYEILDLISNEPEVTIDDIEFSDVRIPMSKPPQMFKEINIPDWRLDELLYKSKLENELFKKLRTTDVGFGSIEELNEGQKSLLIASGAIDAPIKEDKNDLGLILKGTIKKEYKEEVSASEDGKNDKVKVTDNFVTEVYGLDLNTLQFAKYE